MIITDENMIFGAALKTAFLEEKHMNDQKITSHSLKNRMNLFFDSAET